MMSSSGTKPLGFGSSVSLSSASLVVESLAVDSELLDSSIDPVSPSLPAAPEPTGPGPHADSITIIHAGAALRPRIGRSVPRSENEHEQDEHECSAAQQQRVDLILAKTPNQAAGAELFPQLCGTALCHGPDGVSGPGPSLAEEVPEHSVDELACMLLIGPGDMTSLETLADQQLADVIAYVTATF